MYGYISYGAAKIGGACIVLYRMKKVDWELSEEEELFYRKLEIGEAAFFIVGMIQASYQSHVLPVFASGVGQAVALACTRAMQSEELSTSIGSLSLSLSLLCPSVCARDCPELVMQLG